MTAKQQAQCRKKLDVLKRKLSDGVLEDRGSGRETLAAFLPRWLEAIEGTIRPSTHYRYRVIVANHILPAIGRHQLAALKPQHIASLLASLRVPIMRPDGRSEAALAPRTVKYVFTTIRKALGMAVDWGLVVRNVASVVTPPRVPRTELSPPSPAEIKRLIDASEQKGGRFTSFWTLAAHSGAREGELLGLLWSDVDFERGTITIRRTLASAKGGRPVFHETKTGRSRRTVKLSSTPMRALRVQRDRQNFERSSLGDAYHDFGLVFASESGTPIDASNLNHRFKETLKRAGLPSRYRIHDLRHAAATAMLQAGVHPKVASERLGHASVAITLDTYSHLVEGLDADAADRIEDVYRSAV